jgi:hypothetical protein
MVKEFRVLKIRSEALQDNLNAHAKEGFATVVWLLELKTGEILVILAK